ncbi:uncharacterized protein LOC120115319 [Hibiscus syriacus]|uniref:uncharacterized protein LOC120115319 n=1 Tax=Hibiscus syriacus TaxID=106335 RepID=UPI001924631A|nr:uncharacterized protein LOC120115319 [Hibiscus syriacus]
MIRDNWNSNLSLPETIANFTVAATPWIREVFGIIGKNKRLLMARLRGVNDGWINGELEAWLNLNTNYWKKLKSSLIMRKIFGGGGIRIDGINFHDRNTKIFHSKVVCKRRKNTIRMFKIDGEEWCNDFVAFMNAASVFFERLFDNDSVPHGNYPITRLFPTLSDSDHNFFNSYISDDEIRDALFSMAPLKALGVDGIHAQIYQKN